MDRIYGKGMAFLGSALIFFLLLVPLAVPANEKLNKYHNQKNHINKESGTEDQLNEANHYFSNANNITDPDKDNSTPLAHRENFIRRQVKRPGRLLPLQLL